MKTQLLDLLKHKSYRKLSEPVKLASGIYSDTFFDCKQTALTAEGHYLIGKLFYNILKHENVSAIAAVELGGCFLASAISTISERRSPIDVVVVRKAAKDHGSKRLMEGNDHLAIGTRLVLVEDVVTSGGSSINAVKVLRESGYIIDKVICLIDRQEGGADNLKNNGLELVSLFIKTDFI